jgi:hypothetical protein
MARARDVPMPIRRPCSARSPVLWFSLSGGAGSGVQNGNIEMRADQPMTKANTRKLVDAFSGEPVLSPAV